MVFAQVDGQKGAQAQAQANAKASATPGVQVSVPYEVAVVGEAYVTARSVAMTARDSQGDGDGSAGRTPHGQQRADEARHVSGAKAAKELYGDVKLPPGYHWRLPQGANEPIVVRPSGGADEKLRYDPDLGEVVPDPGGRSPPLRFPENTTPQRAFELMGGDDTKTPFGQWVATMESEGLATREKLIQGLDGKKLDGATHDNIRHGLKAPFKDKILARITDPTHLSETAIYKDVLAKTGNKDQALRTASHSEMIRLSNELPTKEKGNLAEAWYLKTFGTKDSSTQVSITQDYAKSKGLTLERDRFADQVEVNTGTVRELKNVTKKLGTEEKEQFADLVDIARNRLTVKAKTHGVDTDVQAKELVMSFLAPQGVQANANFMRTQLAKLGEDAPVKFEIFNQYGQSKIITFDNKHELESAALEKFLRGETK